MHAAAWLSCTSRTRIRVVYGTNAHIVSIYTPGAAQRHNLIFACVSCPVRACVHARRWKLPRSRYGPEPELSKANAAAGKSRCSSPPMPPVPALAKFMFITTELLLAGVTDLQRVLLADCALIHALHIVLDLQGAVRLQSSVHNILHKEFNKKSKSAPLTQDWPEVRNIEVFGVEQPPLVGGPLAMDISPDLAAEVATPDPTASDAASCSSSDFECAVCWSLLLRPVVVSHGPTACAAVFCCSGPAPACS